MRIGEVVGGVALVGVAVLIGIALTDDRQPETITSDTSDTSPFVFDEGTTTTTSAAPVTTEAPPSTVTPETTTSVRGRSSTTTAATTTTAAPPATTVAPTTTLIPPEARASIPVRVLNGGSPPLSATGLSAALRDAGFDPQGAADALTLVDETTVLYAAGGELAALTVNDLVGAKADNIVAASDDDPNWAQFGADLMVLVVLGPTPG